jgi:hypothetical protein
MIARYLVVQWFKLANAMTAWWPVPLMVDDD